jgi:hypothetical protein
MFSTFRLYGLIYLAIVPTVLGLHKNSILPAEQQFFCVFLIKTHKHLIKLRLAEEISSKPATLTFLEDLDLSN